MAGDHVQSPVADTELLPQIAAKSFTPYVHAHRGSAEGEAVACLLQPVAQVVVVPVSETLVEQPDMSQCARAICSVAGTNVIDEGSLNARVSMFEVSPHGARPEPRVSCRRIVPLDRGDLGVVQFFQQCREPPPLENHVLIDLADDRMCRLAYAEVDCGCGASTVAVHETHRALRLERGQQPQRPVNAPVVDDDDLKRSPDFLSRHTGDGAAQCSRTIQNWDHERDAFECRAHARILSAAGCSWRMSL